MKKIYYIIMAVYLVLFAIVANAQTVTTIAGTGTIGYTGDGSAATAAAIGAPAGIVTDAAGNIYFVDLGWDVVRKIDVAGTITTVAGNTSGTYPGDGGPATAALLSTAVGLAVDGSGNLYIADYGHHRIRKVDAAGIITTVAGTGSSGSTGDGGPATAAKLSGPYDVAVDGAGNLFIADRNNRKIRKVDAAGNMSTIAGDGTVGSGGDGGAATSAQFNDPLGVAVDGSGNVYVADYTKVRKINTSGIITTYAGTGTSGFGGDAGPATAAQIAGVIGISTDTYGNLYLASDASVAGNRVRVVRTTGIIESIAGTGAPGYSGDGGPAMTADFYNVKDACADAAGNVYISDAGNHRVRRVVLVNHAPAFTAGATQTLSVCQDGGINSINSLLTVADTDPGQTKTWSTALVPANGILVASYSTTSTGGSLTPTGLTYLPGAGYSGSDLFKVRVTDGTLSDTITISVTVNPRPVPVISVTGSTLSTTVAFVTYQWANSTGPISGATNASYMATATGTYYVTVTDANGCTGGSAGQSVTGVGVVDIAPGTIACYPNPVTHGILNLSIPAGTNKPVHISLTNTIGTMVSETESMTNTEVSLPINVPAGIYFIHAITDNGRYTTKIVVQ